MNPFVQIVIIVSAVLIVCTLHQINKTLRKYMADINETLSNIKTRLTEAKDELLELIRKLREEELTPEGRENLAAIESISNALADVVKPPPET